MLLKEVAARLFEHLVNHDWHGYSWISRWGDGEGTCDIVINGRHIIWSRETGITVLRLSALTRRRVSVVAAQPIPED